MQKKYGVLSLFAIMVVQGCTQLNTTASYASVERTSVTQPKNIIMVVSDGMGPAYTTAYRNFADDPSTPNIENVVFDDILVGNASTYPAPVSGYVTDSAAAATALATGVKSYNGAIAVDVNKQPVESVLQRAKKLGMRTGVAVTSQINHATPACYVAHNESRKNYNELADSFFDDRIDGKFVADVMLGGGTEFFERDDRNLVGEFIDSGYEYVDTYNKLATLPAGANVLGLFAPVGLPAALDDSRPHRLSYLTKNAIKHLENDNGFFLLVEASQVDWAGHSNDIASAMAEMDDLAATIKYLKQYVAAHPDTLVVLTADHSTGGLSIGADGKYVWEPQYIQNMKASVAMVAHRMVDNSDPIALVEEQFGFSLSDEEKAQVTAIASITDSQGRTAGLKTLLDKRTNTGWTTSGHTGVDVEVFAFGAGYDAFIGQIDNTDIANTFFKFLDQKENASDALEQEPVAEGDAKGCDFKSQWRCES
ncbi:alkaline phosphatase [Alteromonas sp. C1M14]|uniref:alkaline phosphatase n=1 Tax=Alteromonas sp. C1M14 TaxID=2841567 RepID=UPI001C0995B6|nr:alkaline phosphatase [Alteromonas sp. C1M14]MBU2979186.1 alkaline phosphatase [Alteromonas sp. C1M14]